MKANNVARAFETKARKQGKGIFIKRSLFKERVLARGKERRIHGPPAHHQIHKQSQWSLIEEAPTHRKEKLFAPLCIAKEHSRDRIHVEKGTMVGNQQDRTIGRK